MEVFFLHPCIIVVVLSWQQTCSGVEDNIAAYKVLEAKGMAHSRCRAFVFCSFFYPCGVMTHVVVSGSRGNHILQILGCLHVEERCAKDSDNR